MMTTETAPAFAFETRPLSATFGAEIVGLDLAAADQRRCGERQAVAVAAFGHGAELVDPELLAAAAAPGGNGDECPDGTVFVRLGGWRYIGCGCEAGGFGGGYYASLVNRRSERDR